MVDVKIIKKFDRVLSLTELRENPLLSNFMYSAKAIAYPSPGHCYDISDSINGINKSFRKILILHLSTDTFL